MKYFVLFGLLMLCSVAHGQRVDRRTIYFDYAETDLATEADSVLSALVRRIEIAGAKSIELKGHTDADGSNAHNQRLSQQRAERIQQYFVAAGVAATKIKVLYFGEGRPAVANTSEPNKQRNRRVEISVKYGQPAPASNASRTKVLLQKPSRSVAQHPAIPKALIQKFVASPQREIIIRGRQGTTIKFEANSLVTETGTPVADEVTIELVEIYSKPEILTTLLHTVSDQNLLETNGMFHLAIKFGNQELALKANGFYQVEFPTTGKRDDMAIFYGETGSGNFNWKKAASNWQSDFTYIDNKKALDKYIFNATKLGWVNCDRFVNQRPITNLLVTANDTTDVNFCLVFKSLKSVMNVSDRQGGISFYNVPSGEVAAVIAFKKLPSGIYYSSKKLVIQPNQTVALTLKKVTDNEFKALISQFQ